jgi:UDP-2,3-diacylglucosamine pyrophosphatase LpxH
MPIYYVLDHQRLAGLFKAPDRVSRVQRVGWKRKLVMIIITDAHVSKTKGNHATFFKMLEALEKNDQELIFLGDIFDLWIALPRYEEDIHHDFVSWCRNQKKYRTIGYMEGNHEYYLADEKKQAFTWCSKDTWWRDNAGALFVHGDQINRRDRNYLFFRKLAKNQIAKFIIRNLPLSPGIVESFKQGLEKTNAEFRMYLPRKEIEYFAESRFSEGVDTIFAGHFHQEYLYRNRESKELYVLPDWFSTQKITFYRRSQKSITFIHWKELGS